MEATNTFKAAIKALGGQKQAAEKLGRSQSTISTYVTGGNAPAEICMQIELATGGKYRAEDMRPDLAETFRGFRTARRGRAA